MSQPNQNPAAAPAKRDLPESEGRSARKILINPKFQLAMIGYVAFLALLTIGVLYFANSYFFYRFEQKGIALGISPDHVYFQFLNEQARIMNQVFLMTAVSVFSLILIGGAILSHRIAGPLYRLRQHLKGLSKGEPLREVHFRRGDFFTELADAMNEHLSALKKPASANGAQAPAPGPKSEEASGEKKTA